MIKVSVQNIYILIKYSNNYINLSKIVYNYTFFFEIEKLKKLSIELFNNNNNLTKDFIENGLIISFEKNLMSNPISKYF